MARAESEYEACGNFDQYSEKEVMKQESAGVDVADVHEVKVEPEAENGGQHGEHDQQQGLSGRQRVAAWWHRVSLVRIRIARLLEVHRRSSLGGMVEAAVPT